MRHQQTGATLIVALVLLVIVSLFGIAGMRGTTLEMKMIASARDRAIAFEAAESTLRKVEKDIIATPPTLTQIKNFTGQCVSDDVQKGFCFGGNFDSNNPYTTCRIFPEDTTEVVNIWESKTSWTDGNFAETEVPVSQKGEADAKTIDTKYFVEFMCFTLKESGLQATLDDKENGDGSLIYMPLYRITALAEGPGQRARVMSQSMVKVNVE